MAPKLAQYSNFGSSLSFSQVQSPQKMFQMEIL